MPYGNDPRRQYTTTAIAAPVIDPLTGEEIPESELLYRTELRNAVIAGELLAALNTDGDWEIGLPEQAQAIQPPSLEGAGLKRPEPPPTLGQPTTEAPAIKRPPPTLGQMPIEPPAIKAPEEPVEVSGQNTLDFNPRLIEKLAPEPVIPQIRQEREAMTGETDPIIQDNIFKALEGLPLPAQQELLSYYRHARSNPDDEVVPNPEQFLEKGLGLSREEAWEYMLNVGREQLTGNVSQPAWEAFADRAAGAILDPVTTAGKAALGEERWEALPAPVQTAAQWAPILVAPQKGLLKDLTIGGAGVRGGTLAIGGAVAGEQIAELTGLNNTVLEFAGAIVSPVLLGRRWAAVEGALRDARANLDEGIDDAAAWDLHAQFEGVRDAKPDDLVTVYHATDEASARSIAEEGFRVNSFVTTDPESGILHAMEKRGVSNPTLISFQVPRSVLRQSKANPIVFTNNQVLRPIATEVHDGFVENAAQAVRDFLRGAEAGYMRVPGLEGRAGLSASDVVAERNAMLEARKTQGRGLSGEALGSKQREWAREDALWAKKVDPDPVGGRLSHDLKIQMAASEYDDAATRAQKLAFWDAYDPVVGKEARLVYRAADGTGNMRVPFGDEPIPDDVARVAFGEEAVQGPTTVTSLDRLDDATNVLRLDADDTASLPDDLLQVRYEEAHKEASIFQDALDNENLTYRELHEITTRFNTMRGPSPTYGEYVDADDLTASRSAVVPREEKLEYLFLSLKDVQDFGEELYRRTNGADGVLPRIKRAIDQFIAAEEGAVRIPNIQIGPQTPSRVVQPHPSTNVVSHFGLKPVVPHLTKAEHVFNIVKASPLNRSGWIGALADPLGTRIAQARRAAEQTNESLATRAVQRLMPLVDGAFNKTYDGHSFKIQSNGRIKGIPSEPTLQDIAAKWPQWRPILTKRQNYVLSTIREELEPYFRDLIEQGVELHTRADVIDGGFYIPRGRADKLAEDGVTVLYDEPRVGPGGRGGKAGFEKGAKFDSMAEGIEAGYKYHSLGEVFQTYFIDSGRRALDSYYANVLKNSVDQGGIPLGETPHARLMQDPKNRALVARIERLRKDLASLSRSVEGLDDRLHGIWEKFIHTPAPDLDDLRYAIRNLFTSGGAIRARTDKATRRLVVDDLRAAVNQGVYQNRGRFRGMTAEQARKAALREALDQVRIRRGRFKGMTYAEGEALLNRIKSTIAGINDDYQDALKLARETPRDQLAISPRGIGVNLQNHTWDWQLASAMNEYLRQPGRASLAANVAFFVPNSLLRMVRATGDLSAAGIQGLLGMFYEPSSYRRALAGMFRATFDPINGRQVLGRFIDDFDRRAVREGLPTSREWAAATLRIGGSETEYTTGFGIGRLPVIHQTNRGFGAFGDILRLDGANAHFKGRMATATGTAQRQALMREIAHGQNLMTGWSPNRVGGDAGNVFLFAPRFFDSQIRLAANALTNNQITGQMARGMFRNLLGAGILLTVAVNESLGNEGFDYTTPRVNGKWNPNFMRMRVAGQDASIFGPWDSLLKAVAAGLDGDVGYIGRTKASPLMSLVYDQITGETFVGDKVPNILNLAKDTAGEIRSMLTGSEYDASGDFGLVGDYFLRSIALPLSLAEPVADFVGGKTGLGEFSAEALVGSSGLKVSPLSNSEQMDQLRRDTVRDLINDGTIPPEKAELYKNTPFHELLSGERKVIDRAIQERHTDQWGDYQQARREFGSIYQIITDQADGARESYKQDYDTLMEQLLTGEAPGGVMKALNELNAKLAGSLKTVYEGGIDKAGKIVASAETKQYVDEIAKLPLNDMRRIEFDYNAITSEVFEKRGGNLRDEDWKAIASRQADFIQKLGDADPSLAQRFVDNLVLKEQFSIEDAHPIVQLKKITNQIMAPYYNIPEDNPEARSAWLTSNPQADFMRWMTSTTNDPVLYSPAAAAKALAEIPTREVEVKLANGKTTTVEGVRLANTRTVITEQNLPTIQKYAKEITQLITIPTSAVDPRNGREYNPREVLREQDPIYDALYYWLGFSTPNAEGVVKVYHPNAVYELVQQWGPRSDRARIGAR